jgi:hypothetical protein
MRSPLEPLPGEVTETRSIEEGESWLAPDSAYVTQIERMARIAYIFPFAVLLLWAWTRKDISGPHLPAGTRAVGRLVEIIVGAMFLTSTLAIVLMRHAAKRMRRMRIGADPTHFLYDPGTGKIERYEWPSVLTDKFRLLIGRRLLSLVQPAGWRRTTMFPAAGLRTLIFARLPPASFVGHTRLQWSALCRGNLSLWVMFGFFLSMMVLQLLKEWHPEWLEAVRAVLTEWLRASVS